MKIHEGNRFEEKLSVFSPVSLKSSKVILVLKTNFKGKLETN